MKSVFLAAGICLVAPIAQAHITFEQAEAPVDSTYKAVLRVPHGCAGEATKVVRIKIPEGVIAVKPMPKAGWKLETVTAPYAATYDYHGTPMDKGVTEIVWTGDLPDAYYDEFVFRGMLAGKWEPGTELYFPIVQECATKTERWIEIPAEGQTEDDLDYPAPSVKLTPAITADD